METNPTASDRMPMINSSDSQALSFIAESRAIERAAQQAVRETLL
jgi:hypothetical protein